MTRETSETVEAALARTGSPVHLLRDLQSRATTFPVQPEFTNWRSEQHAWATTCALLDQSHHMTDLFISGPDAERLLSDLAVNSFTGFGVGKAKQFIAISPEGLLIGDAILFHLEEDLYDLVGHPFVLDWVQFHLERGGYDATTRRDDNSAVRTSGPPALYRYELQGPTALRRGGGRQRRPRARGEVLRHHAADHRRAPRHRPAARHGRPARLRAVRTLARRRGRPRSTAASRRGARPGARRGEGVLDVEPRVGLGAGAVPGDLLRPPRSWPSTGRGCPRRSSGRSGAASPPTTWPPTPSTRSRSATGAASSSTTTSSAARHWSAERPAPPGRR
ncbi:MAG: hypothetical protein PGN11_10385 [Quadrisphaera sp.]